MHNNIKTPKQSKSVHSIRSLYLAILDPAPGLFPLILRILSSFCFNCSWILRFCAHPSLSFCILKAAMTANAADLSLGRRSCTVMSGVMPICEIRSKSSWLL